MNVIPRIFVTRALRNVAYGWLAVTLGLVLDAHGFNPWEIGMLLALALATGALFTAYTGRLARRFDRRPTLVVAALLMAVSGVLLAAPSSVATIVALLLGTVSAGTQEVGPFAALEQTLIADVAGVKAASVFGHYNLIGAFTVALGASIPSFLPTSAAPYGYALLALILALVYASMPSVATPPHEPATDTISGRIPRVVERLTALFAVDAFGGGLIVQSFLAYWFVVRFHTDGRTLGIMFFAFNTLAACSLLMAAPLAKRIGPVRTMVYTHLPSNLLLAIVPLMPSFEFAAICLFVRFSLSQVDVPVRQALVMTIVPPQDRPRAAGITNAVRPAAAAVGPIIAGFSMATAALGLPFYLAGGIKAAYDLAIFAQFQHVDIDIHQASRQP